ncbi:monovalent cation:proton antiporter-2 (CPA2) family protein [Pseudomonadales bacterium]|nr:monovalent cation:proton antiporter-2 (CPA2) family protein [Pseudomonadales bacterium]MDA9366627.1 monovalent cation:proton antiporter-2 (CPA2) family protein [Pseudomonadales bacterium]MDB4151276.1 monovalent cation:proton antiporter-2 (CPA2) family protein [Pseudomonadales bacterium]
MHDLLINAVIYLAAAVIAVPLFEKLRLGAILGYLAAGIAIGPWGLAIISDPTDTLHLAELGVVMLLFLIGLELSPTTLWRMRNWIVMLGATQLLGTAALIVGLLLWALALDLSIALMIGLALALSSTAFAIQLLTSYRVLDTALGQKGFAILLFQDLAVIPILLYVEALAGAGDEAEGAWWVGALLIIGVLVAGRYLLNPLLRLVANYNSSELMTAAALLIVLGMALLIEAAGLSMGMGAFIAGILLANSSFKHQLETEVEPFKGLLLGLFFIAIGMTLDIGLLFDKPLLIIGLALLLMTAKTLIVGILAKLAGSPTNDAMRLGLILSQGGEFAFVVMSHAKIAAVIDVDLANTVALIVGLSMAMTSPLLVLYNKIITSRRGAGAENYDSSWGESEPEVIIAGFGRVGQITGRLLTANGIQFTALDKNAEHIEFVRKFGNKVFFGDATRFGLLETAGIRHARVLLVAIAEEEDALEIIRLVRAECPHIKIVSRAHNRTNLLRQRQAGADLAVREMFGSSVEMAGAVLRGIGISDDNAAELSRLFTHHDQGLIEEALSRPVEMDQLIKMGLEGSKELEILFSQDKGDLS